MNFNKFCLKFFNFQTDFSIYQTNFMQKFKIKIIRGMFGLRHEKKHHSFSSSIKFFLLFFTCVIYPANENRFFFSSCFCSIYANAKTTIAHFMFFFSILLFFVSWICVFYFSFENVKNLVQILISFFSSKISFHYLCIWICSKCFLFPCNTVFRIRKAFLYSHFSVCLFFFFFFLFDKICYAVFSLRSIFGVIQHITVWLLLYICVYLLLVFFYILFYPCSVEFLVLKWFEIFQTLYSWIYIFSIVLELCFWINRYTINEN